MTKTQTTQPLFQTLAIRLLKAGIAPRHIKRILGELEDHFADLRDQALENGVSPEGASKEALTRLGSIDELVNETASKPELRSWSSRWPWAVYGIAPLFTFFLGMLCLGSLMGLLAGDMTASTEFSIALKRFIETGFFVIEYILPLSVVILFTYQVVRRHDSLKWLIFGLVLQCFFVAGLHFQIQWPEGDLQGFLSISSSQLPPYPQKSEFLAKLIFNLFCIGVCIKFFRAVFLKNNIQLANLPEDNQT